MRKAAATAALGILALTPVAATAKKPPKPPGQGATLTLAAKPSPVVYGRSTALTGRLKGSNKAGRTVTLRSDPFPFGSLSPSGTAVTNQQGGYSFARKPLVNTRYQTKVGGDQSSVVTVLVRMRVSVHLSDSTPRAGRRVRFSGRACPRHDGGLVRIQRLSGGRWRTLRRTRLRSAPRCSRYSRRLRVRRDGTFRVTVKPDAAHATGISRRRRIDVH
jgi:hypothetical protein